MAFVGLVCSLAGTGEAATKYVSFATGSEANSGNSTGAPYKFSPGMKGSTSGYVPSPGDTIVFRGGDTWPATCFQFAISQAGVTYTSDPSWYVGASFSRPVFDGQNTLVSNLLNQYGWQFSALVYVGTVDNITISGIEFARHRSSLAPADQGNSCIVLYGNCANVTITNNLFRDWSIPTPASGQDGGGEGGVRTKDGTSYSGLLIVNNEFTQQGISQRSGVAIQLGGTIRGNYIHHTASGFLGGGTVQNNILAYLEKPTDPAAHSNAIYLQTPGSVTGNIIHDTVAEAQVIYISPTLAGSPGTANVWNNLVYNTAQPCLSTDMEKGHSEPLNVLNCWNNTFVGPNGSGTCIRIARPPWTWGTINVRNNHLITSGIDVGYNNPGAGFANVTSSTVVNNLTHTLAQANALGYNTANGFAPTLATSPTYNVGVDLSASFTTDVLGTSRPQAAVWDIGAYEFIPSGAGTPGTIVLSVSSATVTETGGSIVVTARRTGGTTGAVGASYATANGTATAGVNFTTTAGTFSWGNGDGADKTVSVPILVQPFYGSKSFTFTISSPSGGAVLGDPSSQTITINGTGSAPINLLSGLSWSAPSDLATPFTSSGIYYSQSIGTSLASGGIANYYFTNAAGTYKPFMLVDAPGDGNNSVWFVINGAPVDPNNIFDVVDYTAGAEWRAVSQRGPTGTPYVQDTNSIAVYLEAGVTNHVQVVGRESGTKVYTLEMRLVAEPPPVVPPSVIGTLLTSMDGYYKAGATIAFQITFSTNVTVTGTPTVSLNSGGSGNYSSGSGTDTLTFSYTVGSGQNSQYLDYSATNSLVLSGGTIKNGTTDALLNLPVPSNPGSLSYNRRIVIDTTPPSVSISGPDLILTTPANQVIYVVTYTDQNFAINTLAPGDVTINGTTTGTVMLGPFSSPMTQVAVTLSSLTVGTGSITVAPGTAVDLAGNLSGGAGPSAGFTVSSVLGGTANAISAKTGVIISNPAP